MKKSYYIIPTIILLLFIMVSCSNANKNNNDANPNTTESTALQTTETTTDTLTLDTTLSVENDDVYTLLTGVWDGETGSADGTIEEYIFKENNIFTAVRKNGNNSSKSAQGTYRISEEEGLIYISFPNGEISPMSEFITATGEKAVFSYEITDEGKLTLIRISSEVSLSKQ